MLLFPYSTLLSVSLYVFSPKNLSVNELVNTCRLINYPFRENEEGIALYTTENSHRCGNFQVPFVFVRECFEIDFPFAHMRQAVTY